MSCNICDVVERLRSKTAHTAALFHQNSKILACVTDSLRLGTGKLAVATRLLLILLLWLEFLRDFFRGSEYANRIAAHDLANLIFLITAV